MADIFLSYASEDRDRLRPLVETLEAEGWSVWWDRNLHAGPRFDVAIEEAIRAASCVVVAWSEHAIESAWIRDEASEGQERNILVPLILNDVRAPMGFRAAQTANLVGWPEARGELDMLLAGIRELVGSRNAADTARQVVGDPLLSDGPRDSGSRHDTTEQKSIAVLPLVNMSSDPEQEYFSDGVAEELLNGLAKIPGLRVVARAASFLFRDQRADLETIGRELNVNYILDGSVRKAGERIRITAQLIRVADGSHIWSENYDGDLSDIFELQDRVAAAVVSALKLRLEATGRGTLIDVGTDNPKAYNEWLLAQYQSNRNSVEANAKAIRHLEQAIELDDGFVAAYIMSAFLYMRRAQYFGADALADMRARATPLIEKAKALDPNRQAPGPGWSWVDDYECPDEESKERMYRERIKDPSHPGNRGNQARAFAMYGQVLANGGFFRSFNRYCQKALDIDPDNDGILNSLARSYSFLGEHDASVEIYEQALAIEPYSNHLRANWLMALIDGGRLEQAEAYLHRKERAPDNHFEFELLLARGEREAASEVLDLVVKGDLAGPVVKAGCLLRAGELDQAFDWFLKAIEHDDVNVRHIRADVQRLSSVDLREQVTQHPRFQALLEKMGIGPAWKEELGRRAATLTPITGIEVAEL